MQVGDGSVTAAGSVVTRDVRPHQLVARLESGVLRGVMALPPATAKAASTREAFLPDRFGKDPEARLYRTGDLGVSLDGRPAPAAAAWIPRLSWTRPAALARRQGRRPALSEWHRYVSSSAGVFGK